MPSPRLDLLAPYQADLDALRDRDRFRALSGRRGLDFASNDYLGLAESEEYREAARAALARGVPLGAGGSRLLRGNHPEHEALEEEAARFFGAESALFFGAGFSANEALLATLPQRGDIILYDELIHASAHEGMRLSRAESRAVEHNDAGAFQEAVRAASGAGRIWIVVESLYSMDGDIAPLETLAGIAGRHGAFLLIDEAHATGVLGLGGRGLAHGLEGQDNVVTLHTCGKALGLSGGLVCLPRALREFLINRCRNFIFATAPSPLLAAAIRAALGVIERADDRRAALAERVRRVDEALRRLTDAEPSGTHIQPVIVGSDKRALALAERMQAHGHDIRAIRPPTVPEGTARLRISLTLNVSDAQTDAMIALLAQELKRPSASARPEGTGAL
jgi:8-amino-7-oxononanoate synthase